MSSDLRPIVSFEVVPEHCIRNDQLELILGTPINQVINGIQNVYRTIKNVELTYCTKEPFGRDITITLQNNGIRMYFDSHSQVLRMIELFDFSHVTLHYCHNVFSSPEEPADVGKVEKCFGATVPGGVSFCFPAKESSSVQASYAHGLSSLSFASSALPQLERMTLFNGISPAKMKIILVENLNSEDGRLIGLKIRFKIEEVTDHSVDELQLVEIERPIFFNDTQEAVMTKLGAPSKIYYKSEEKMLIQRSTTGSERLNDGEDDKADFFFNYFSLGMDLLFDIETRRLVKFVLHTNVPGHFDFGIYDRCEFLLKAETKSMEELNIGTESKLESFRSLFDHQTNSNITSGNNDSFSGPVVLNKSSSEGENPFGSSFCYGTDQMIFEVLDNGHIASVVLFDPLLGP
ncbi:unnamed protein product [Meloidogyne enterolobii]|uniref:Uncharacterized protein n=1 Tax=Meloidogyne enterolobii TaxID=390850 RepID=A0ACB1AFU8_MELEN